MSASSDKLRILVPALASVTDYPDAVVDEFLSTAALLHDANAWGAAFATAMIYYGAHLMLTAYPDGVAGSGTASGPVTSRRAGDLAVTYAAAPSVANATADDVALLQTAPGRVYLQIRGGRAARGPRVVCS